VVGDGAVPFTSLITTAQPSLFLLLLALGITTGSPPMRQVSIWWR